MNALQPFAPSFKPLLAGYDTIECAYYLQGVGLDFERLAVEKDNLKAGKYKQKLLRLGSEEFMLAASGTSSGYPYKLQNALFSIQCGEFNQPNFYVTFSSFGLWHHGAETLHQRFLAWAQGLGYVPYQEETLSRVDYAFDYQIPVLDFDQENFVTVSDNDSRHRKRRKVQTMQFGCSPVILRAYDKSAEITSSSGKTWFYPIWNAQENVWRIEWEIRKQVLRDYGIKSFASLWQNQGALLHHLANNHTSLRITSDAEPKQRPMHPLWLDMLARIDTLPANIYHPCDEKQLLEQRMMRMAISIYGYLKRMSAINLLQQTAYEDDPHGAIDILRDHIDRIHDPITWAFDVRRKANEIRMGQ